MPNDQYFGINFVDLVKNDVCCNGKQKLWNANEDWITYLWIPVIGQDPVVLDQETNKWFLSWQISNLKGRWERKRKRREERRLICTESTKESRRSLKKHYQQCQHTSSQVAGVAKFDFAYSAEKPWAGNVQVHVWKSRMWVMKASQEREQNWLLGIWQQAIRQPKKSKG